MYIGLRTLASLALIALLPLSANAAPGERDTSFGSGGGFHFGLPGHQLTQLNRVLVQSDGKLVAVGFAQTTTTATADFFIARFNANGSIDTSFGPLANGNVVIDVSLTGVNDSAIGIAQQVDGRLIVVGASTQGGISRMTAIRLLSNGSLDTSFDSDGMMSVSTASVSSAVDALIQNDGTIVLAGSISTGGGTGSDYALVKLLANGTVDTTPGFGTAGIAIFNIGTGGAADAATRALQQTDGKFIIVGRSVLSAQTSLSMVRANANGSIDSTFAGVGYIVTPCVGACLVNTAALQADGKIVLAGTDAQPSVGSPALSQEISFVARLNTDGTMDTTFGADGDGIVDSVLRRYAPTFIPSGDHLSGLVIDPVTQAITVYGGMTWRLYNTPGGGASTVLASGGVAAARLMPNGAIDTSFGSGGVAIANYGTMPSPISANVVNPRTLVRQPDGRLVAASLSGQFQSGVIQAANVSMARFVEVGSDPGIITYSFTGPIMESIGTANLRVFRHSGSTGAVSVAYSTSSGTALAGLDFTSVSGILNWADGDYSVKTVTIPIIADGITEFANETFNFDLSSATGGAQIVGGTLSIGIVRDDIAPTNTVAFTQSAVSVNENAATAALTVNRTGTANISVGYYTIAESARANSDYASTSGTLVWSTGDMAPKTITVPIVNDSAQDANETFRVVLVIPGGGVTMGAHATQITIADDDTPPPAPPSDSGGSGAMNLWLLLALCLLLGWMALRRTSDLQRTFGTEEP